MRRSIEMKSLKKPPDQRQESFSLLATLDQYEVEEINAKQFVSLVRQTRHRGSSIHPSAA
jgi:hypothetical protein